MNIVQLLLNSRIILACQDDCPSCAGNGSAVGSDQGCGKGSCNKCWRCMFTLKIREWLQDDCNRSVIKEMEKHNELIVGSGRERVGCGSFSEIGLKNVNNL